MKRIALLTVGLVALVATGAAVAHLKASGVKSVAATFSATSVSNLETRTCTGEDGTYEIATAKYEGTATSSEATLAGPVQAKVRSVYNVAKNLGVVEGWLRIRSSAGNTTGRIWAVNTNGALDGFVRGEAGHGDGALLASLTAAFTRTGGFASGQLGGGGGANAAVIAGRLNCKGNTRPSVRLVVRGEVDAVSSTSISVKPSDGSATQTCAVTSESPKLDKIEKGDHVEMQCSQIGGAMVLTKIHERR